jgi:hypothetical protein
MRGTILAIVFAAACAEAPPVKTTLPVHMVKTPDPPEVTQEGVTVGISPIDHFNWQRHAALSARISWQELDRNAPVVLGASGTSSPRVTRHDTVALVPLPALRILIRNETQKPLKFKSAQLAGGPHKWTAFDSAGDVQGRVTNDIMNSHPAVADNRGMLDGVSRAIAELPIATPSLTIAPGAVWDGFVTFKLESHDADEFNEQMANAEKLTFSMELEGAPGFSFTLPRDTQQKQLTCPGDLKKPSLKKCKEG